MLKNLGNSKLDNLNIKQSDRIDMLFKIMYLVEIMLNISIQFEAILLPYWEERMLRSTVIFLV